MLAQQQLVMNKKERAGQKEAARCFLRTFVSLAVYMRARDRGNTRPGRIHTHQSRACRVRIDRWQPSFSKCHIPRRLINLCNIYFFNYFLNRAGLNNAVGLEATMPSQIRGSLP